MSSALRMFRPGQRVVCVATGSVYRIVDVPPRLRIERSGEVAYSYTRDSGDDITLWVSSHTDVEGGRFVAEGIRS